MVHKILHVRQNEKVVDQVGYDDSTSKLECGRGNQSLIIPRIQRKRFDTKAIKHALFSAKKFLLGLQRAAIVTSVFSHDKCYIWECDPNDFDVSSSIHMENAKFFFHTEFCTYPHLNSPQAHVLQPTSPPNSEYYLSVYLSASFTFIEHIWATWNKHDLTHKVWITSCWKSLYRERLNLCQVWEQNAVMAKYNLSLSENLGKYNLNNWKAKALWKRRPQ